MKIVVIKSAGMNAETKKRVKENKAKKVCIYCGSKPPYKREACTTCHGRFIAQRPDDDEAAAIYEAECIDKGMVSENRQGKRQQKNEFKKVAEKAKRKAKAS